MLLSSSFFPRRPIAGQPQRVEAVALWSLQAISANVTAVMLIPPIQHGMLQRGLCWRMTHLVRLDG